MKKLKFKNWIAAYIWKQVEGKLRERHVYFNQGSVRGLIQEAMQEHIRAIKNQLHQNREMEILESSDLEYLFTRIRGAEHTVENMRALHDTLRETVCRYNARLEILEKKGKSDEHAPAR